MLDRKWRTWTLDWRAFAEGWGWGLLPPVQALIVSLVLLVAAGTLGPPLPDEDLVGDAFTAVWFALANWLFWLQLRDRMRRAPGSYPAFAFGVYAGNELVSALLLGMVDLDHYFPATTTRLAEVVFDLAWRPALLALMVVVYRTAGRAST